MRYPSPPCAVVDLTAILGGMIKDFAQAFLPLFVAVDPIGLVAIFLALARGTARPQRQRIARHAILTGGGVALLFLFLGKSIFEAIGISVSDFQVAGGLILFILAARDLIHSTSELPETLAEGFGVVPLGMPLIAGPAMIAALLLLTHTVGLWMTLAALISTRDFQNRVDAPRRYRHSHDSDRRARVAGLGKHKAQTGRPSPLVNRARPAERGVPYRAPNYTSSSFQQYSCMRGMWKGPFHSPPLSCVEIRPSRCA